MLLNVSRGVSWGEEVEGLSSKGDRENVKDRGTSESAK